MSNFAQKFNKEGILDSFFLGVKGVKELWG